MNKRIENEFLEASNFSNWVNKITIKNWFLEYIELKQNKTHYNRIIIIIIYITAMVICESKTKKRETKTEICIHKTRDGKDVLDKIYEEIQQSLNNWNVKP
jgi:hypothetical protein